MSNSTSVKFASLLQDQIDTLIQELIDLKSEFISGQKPASVFRIEAGDDWPSDVPMMVSSSMTLQKFTRLFEELNGKLEQLQLQQAEW